MAARGRHGVRAAAAAGSRGDFSGLGRWVRPRPFLFPRRRHDWRRMAPRRFHGIVYEDDEILVVNKPAGLLTQAPPGIPSLEALVRARQVEDPRNRTLAQLAALGYPIQLSRWEEGAESERAPPRKPTLTVTISGANYVKPKPQRPPAAPPAEREKPAAAEPLPHGLTNGAGHPHSQTNCAGYNDRVL